MIAIGKYLEDPETGKRLIIKAVEGQHVLCRVQPRRKPAKAARTRQGARRSRPAPRRKT
jgi:hypothetical protein